MKKVKILTIIIAVILMFGAFPIYSFAEENQSINYNVSVNVNGELHYGGEIEIAIGEAFDIAIFEYNEDNVNVGATLVTDEVEEKETETV